MKNEHKRQDTLLFTLNFWVDLIDGLAHEYQEMKRWLKVCGKLVVNPTSWPEFLPCSCVSWS